MIAKAFATTDWNCALAIDQSLALKNSHVMWKCLFALAGPLSMTRVFYLLCHCCFLYLSLSVFKYSKELFLRRGNGAIWKKFAILCCLLSDFIYLQNSLTIVSIKIYSNKVLLVGSHRVGSSFSDHVHSTDNYKSLDTNRHSVVGLRKEIMARK